MSSLFDPEKFNTMSFNQQSDIVDATIDIPSGNGVWGYQKKGYERPELLAPPQEASGGFLYLPGNVDPTLITNIVDLSRMLKQSKSYAIQVIDAPEGMESELGYMRKIVVASHFALRHMYNVVSEANYDKLPNQDINADELVNLFVADEQRKYGTHFGSLGLAGKFGGDGNYAQEDLGFGLAIENDYYGVISVWSRGWLCTK